MSSSSVAGLRSIRAAKENLRLAMAMVPVLATCSLVGGIVWGIQAALAGICVGYGIYAIAGWTLLVRSAHRLVPGGGESSGTASGSPRPAGEDEAVSEVAIEAAGAGI
jgi:hypothetical protein